MGKVYLTLDEKLTRRSISRYELAKRTGIRYPIIDNYYKNKVVRYDSYGAIQKGDEFQTPVLRPRYGRDNAVFRNHSACAYT